MRNLGHKLSFRRIIALLMIAVALFPVISTTDDEVRYAFLHKGSDSSNSVLNALLDSLDAAQVTHSVARPSAWPSPVRFRRWRSTPHPMSSLPALAERHLFRRKLYSFL